MQGAPKLTYDFVMGQLRVALVAFLAYGAGRGWFTTADATLVQALATSLAPIAIPWAWSIYRNLGTRIVPSSEAEAKEN